MVSGDATQSSGCSQEHPDLKKKIIYNNLNFFICLPLKKIGTPSKFLCQTNFELKSIKKKKKRNCNRESEKKKNRRWKKRKKEKRTRWRHQAEPVWERKYKRRRRGKRLEKRLKRAPEPLKIEETSELWKWEEEEGVVRWDEK